MEKSKKGKEPKNFEEALSALETIAHELESGELGLEESLEKYENGIAFARFCKDKLDEAERTIEILQKDGTKKAKKKKITVKEESGEVADGEDIQGSLL